MNEPKRCPRCATALAPDAAEGFCPACLLQAGIGHTESSGTRQRFIPPTPEELGASFPQFEIVELIGQGGMGAVYKVRQPHLDRIVALKVLPPDLGRDPGFAERFLREARALARLSHQHLVTIHDFGQAGEYCWFLMEYVDGANLRQVMATGTLSPNQALAIVPQLCEALQYAHDEGIVHRDIKPENILLDRKGRVKIADFGLAKLVGIQANAKPQESLTATGDVLGTMHYMAPEQVERSGVVDHRADIYSLGVVLYEMLTGSLPLGRFQAPSKTNGIDERIDEVVFKTLEKDPQRRYQQADEVKTDVNRVRQPAEIPIEPEKPAERRAKPPPRIKNDMYPQPAPTIVQRPPSMFHAAVSGFFRLMIAIVIATTLCFIAVLGVAAWRTDLTIEQALREMGIKLQFGTVHSVPNRSVKAEPESLDALIKHLRKEVLALPSCGGIYNNIEKVSQTAADGTKISVDKFSWFCREFDQASARIVEANQQIHADPAALPSANELRRVLDSMEEQAHVMGLWSSATANRYYGTMGDRTLAAHLDAIATTANYLSKHSEEIGALNSVAFEDLWAVVARNAKDKRVQVLEEACKRFWFTNRQAAKLWSACTTNEGRAAAAKFLRPRVTNSEMFFIDSESIYPEAFEGRSIFPEAFEGRARVPPPPAGF
jgi:serine/threonine protein kinase